MEPLQEILSCVNGNCDLDIVKDYQAEIAGQKRHTFLVAILRDFPVDGLNRLLDEVARRCSFEIEVVPFSENLNSLRYGGLHFFLEDDGRPTQYFFGFYPDRSTAERVDFKSR